MWKPHCIQAAYTWTPSPRSQALSLSNSTDWPCLTAGIFGQLRSMRKTRRNRSSGTILSQEQLTRCLPVYHLSIFTWVWARSGWIPFPIKSHLCFYRIKWLPLLCLLCAVSLLKSLSFNRSLVLDVTNHQGSSMPPNGRNQMLQSEVGDKPKLGLNFCRKCVKGTEISSQTWKKNQCIRGPRKIHRKCIA